MNESETKTRVFWCTCKRHVLGHISIFWAQERQRERERQEKRVWDIKKVIKQEYNKRRVHTRQTDMNRIKGETVRSRSSETEKRKRQTEIKWKRSLRQTRAVRKTQRKRQTGIEWQWMCSCVWVSQLTELWLHAERNHYLWLPVIQADRVFIFHQWQVTPVYCEKDRHYKRERMTDLMLMKTHFAHSHNDVIWDNKSKPLSCINAGGRKALW